MTTPLVSILMPAYNASEWIAQSIESALAQSWPRKELIIVDDGSADTTFQIAGGYESRSVKVARQENRGAAAARNAAYRLSQGQYIQWLDADDLIAPEKIALQMAVAREESDDVLISSSFASFFCRTSKASFQPTLLWRDLEPRDWIVTKFQHNLWMNPAVWLVSRELSEKAGPWNEELTLDDDGEHFNRLVAACTRVPFVPEARSFYRQWNSGSLSRRVSERACRSLLTSLKLSIGYLLQLEDSSRTRAASVNLLQTWFHYFYPEKVQMVQEARELAATLGGKLHQPRLNRKYRPIKAFFGWPVAKRAMSLVADAKLSAACRWDRLLWKLEGPQETMVPHRESGEPRLQE